jgi:hypothetical protein
MLIRHARLALVWEVVAVLEDWMTRQYRDVVRHAPGNTQVQMPRARPAPRAAIREGRFCARGAALR